MRNQFTITQTGVIELTENLGGDHAFSFGVSVKLRREYKGKELRGFTGLYYHAGEGWQPIDDGSEISLSKVKPKLNDDEENTLSIALNDFGQCVLLRLFKLGDALYGKTHADVAMALVDNNLCLKPLVKTYPVRRF